MRRAFVLWCLIASSASAQTPLTKLFADGNHDPVTNLPYKIVSVTGGGGKVFVEGTLLGAGVTTANDRAYLFGDLSAPQMIYREGDALTANPGYTLSNASGSIGSNGLLAVGVFGGPTNDRRFAAIIGSGAAAQVVAKSGDIAPGIGSVMTSARPYAALSPTQYAMTVDLPKPAGSSSSPFAYYRTRTDGSLQLMSQSGTVMSGLNPENKSSLILNPIYKSSYAMWSLFYDTPNYQWGSSRVGLFMTRDSGTALVVKEGDAQPVSPPAGAAAPRVLHLADDGKYTFVSGFHDDATNFYYGAGIYSGDTNGYSMRRLPTQVFTDQPGRKLSALHTYDSNASGLIAIAGDLANSDWSQTYATVGVGTADAGFRTVAVRGGVAPGLGGLTFSDIDSPSAANTDFVSDLGDVAFLGVLSGTGVDSTNDKSLWMFDRNGLKKMLAREGQTLLVDGISKTIGTLGIGTSFFDVDASRFIFSATFTDNSRAYFAAPVVPEPAMGLCAAGFAAMTLGRRRRLR